MKQNQFYSPSDENQKENQSLRLNYSHQKSNKKFNYSHFQHPKITKNQYHTQSNQNINQSEQVKQLKQALAEERKKVKYLQSKTIQEQLNVLDSLQMLQSKFQGISQQKLKIENELKRYKNQNDWRQKYENLLQQHKKIKGIADSLIDMMNKIQGSNGNLHQAWRWIKRVVWQYQTIKKKAFEWKQVYDEVNQAVQQMNKQN